MRNNERERMWTLKEAKAEARRKAKKFGVPFAALKLHNGRWATWRIDPLAFALYVGAPGYPFVYVPAKCVAQVASV